MEAVLTSARRVRAGAYRVVEGPVDWATFPFDVNPLGFALMSDDDELFPTADGARTSSLSIEMVGKMPTTEEQLSSVYEPLKDQLNADAVAIIEDLQVAENQQGDSVVHVIAEVRSISISDVTMRVTGIVVQFKVRY